MGCCLVRNEDKVIVRIGISKSVDHELDLTT